MTEAARKSQKRLRVAIQMDHVSTVKIAGDSGFALLLEAQARGHELFHYTPDRLAMRDGVVTAALEPITVRDTAGDHFTLGRAGTPAPRWARRRADAPGPAPSTSPM